MEAVSAHKAAIIIAPLRKVTFVCPNCHPLRFNLKVAPPKIQLPVARSLFFKPCRDEDVSIIDWETFLETQGSRKRTLFTGRIAHRRKRRDLRLKIFYEMQLNT